MTEGTVVEWSVAGGFVQTGVVQAAYVGDRVWVKMDQYDPDRYPDGWKVFRVCDLRVVK